MYTEQVKSEDNLRAKISISVCFSCVFLKKNSFPTSYALFQTTVWFWSTWIRLLSNEAKAEDMLEGGLQGTPTVCEPSAPRIWSKPPWNVHCDNTICSALTAFTAHPLLLHRAICWCRHHGWITFKHSCISLLFCML